MTVYDDGPIASPVYDKFIKNHFRGKCRQTGTDSQIWLSMLVAMMVQLPLPLPLLDGRLINDGQRWDNGVAVNQHRKPTSRTATQAYPGMTHATWHGHVARSIY